MPVQGTGAEHPRRGQSLRADPRRHRSGRGGGDCAHGIVPARPLGADPRPWWRADAHTLNFDYEVRPGDEAFEELPGTQADEEMLDLAMHIIKKKAGRFDPTKFDDRYDAALLELVKAKMEGRKITPPKAPEATKPSDLMEALRQSAEATGDSSRAAKRKTSSRKTAARKTAKRRKAA
jgi:hypothetical protein